MSFKFNPLTGNFCLTSAAGNSFTIMQPDSGTSPTASSSSDTLTLTSSDKTLTVSGNSSTKTLDFKEAGNYSAGNSGTALTITWTNGPAQEVTMTGNCTFTFASPRAGVAYVLKVTQDATGGRSATWPAAVKWSGGTAPTLSAANKVDLISFYYDGTNYFGSFVLNF